MPQDHTNSPVATSPPDGLLILHLGLGSFHRAHQAVYLQRLIESGQTRWSIAAGNLRPEMAELVDVLARAGGRYTLETVSPAGVHRYEQIASIRRVVRYEPLIAELIALGSAPNTRIISFTVTEAGYYLDPKNRLDLAFPGLKPGDRWCLCAPRWKEALDAGAAPQLVLAATHEETLAIVPLGVLKDHAA